MTLAKVSSKSVIIEYKTQYVSHCWSSTGDLVSIALIEAYLSKKPAHQNKSFKQFSLRKLKHKQSNHIL